MISSSFVGMSVTRIYPKRLHLTYSASSHTVPLNSLTEESTMRPTGIVLIAIYHFLAAAFLVLRGDYAWSWWQRPGRHVRRGQQRPTGWRGLFRRRRRSCFHAGLCRSPRSPAMACGHFASGDASCASCWPPSHLFSSLPGLLFMGLHFGFFMGGYRLIKLAISVLIIWYLLQPQIRSLFQRSAPALP